MDGSILFKKFLISAHKLCPADVYVTSKLAECLLLCSKYDEALVAADLVLQKVNDNICFNDFDIFF